ncbi:MAG: hypothetical protein BGO38_05360 [Cellulomonas sp. 73-145]|uniref:TrbC/VirB2 family protein n=1 Tax=Cellulomonas sp. 73-145 TaxID=1895739 RepID=UPI00092846B1|nr:TrbC/VirB2 family protein [Cellulomonas sp. 73-145]MBN9326846.1 hypothetical protein [Cellulomonas sp.]OJV57563.1 MAG: hypothetical protein BGO38_05360 [Cellulomonas sp. 73-145]
MQTIERTEAAPAPVKVGRFARFMSKTRNRIALTLSAAAVTVLAPEAAFATTPSTDPTGGAGDTFFTSLTSYLQGHLIVAVLGLAVIGISVGMLLGWGKKAAKSK